MSIGGHGGPVSHLAVVGIMAVLHGADDTNFASGFSDFRLRPAGSARHRRRLSDRPSSLLLGFRPDRAPPVCPRRRMLAGIVCVGGLYAMSKLSVRRRLTGRPRVGDGNFGVLTRRLASVAMASVLLPTTLDLGVIAAWMFIDRAIGPSAGDG
jgi:hypothetical protein